MKTIKIEKKKIEKLPSNYLAFMNRSRRNEYGKNYEPITRKEDKGAIFFFVKDNGKIMAFGMLKPVIVTYLGKKYYILGIGRGMAIKKRQGYGRILNNARIKHLKKTGKTGIGFTGRRNKIFFEKVGLKFKSNLIRGFVYVNPKTGEKIYDNDGDVIYYEGKDKLISKMLKNKSMASINVPFW